MADVLSVRTVQLDGNEGVYGLAILAKNALEENVSTGYIKENKINTRNYFHLRPFNVEKYKHKYEQY
ncbi:MAG: hypothetical protein QM793_07305 [Muricomes sp.]